MVAIRPNTDAIMRSGVTPGETLYVRLSASAVVRRHEHDRATRTVAVLGSEIVVVAKGYSAPPRAAAPRCRLGPVTRAVGAPPVDVGAAVLAVSGRRLKRAAHADKVATSTLEAEARRGIKGWGGHERSVRALTGKGNGTKVAADAPGVVVGVLPRGQPPSAQRRRPTTFAPIHSV